MAGAVLRANSGLQHQVPAATRDEVLARYRRLRAISRQHHSAVMSFLSQGALLQQGRRLGLANGKTFLLDSMDELTLVFDLAIYTAPAGRSRAIDRYAQSAQFTRGSDEALMLDAMCNARFAIMMVQGQHPVAGLLVTDVFRQVDLWLMDEGLEQSLTEGELFATRYFTPADFAMTAGVVIPADPLLVEAAILTMPPQADRLSVAEAIEDRRLAEAIYRIAVAEAVMEGVEYRDPGGEAT